MIKIKLKDITFYSGSNEEIYDKFLRSQILVAPAASALADLEKKSEYYEALKNSDIAILDSGFFCILLRILKKIKVKKLSGYLFLDLFLNNVEKNSKILLINPSEKSRLLNEKLLKKNKFQNFSSYTAPIYEKKLEDLKLIKLIDNYNPSYIIINLGGGVQEILAQYIKLKIRKKINIICTGAAIAFMTGEQAPINRVVDKYYLGWLVRLLFDPKTYLKRTIVSFKIIKYFIRGEVKLAD